MKTLWMTLLLMMNVSMLQAEGDPNFSPMVSEKKAASRVLTVSPEEDWVAVLSKGEVNYILRFVIGQSEVYSLKTKEPTEIYDSYQVFQMKPAKLKGAGMTVFVARWKSGKYDRIYIVEPLAIKKKKNPLRVSQLVDYLESMELSKDGDAIVFTYLKEKAELGPDGSKQFKKETFIWRP